MMAPFLFSSVNGKSKYYPYLCRKSVNALQSTDNNKRYEKNKTHPTHGSYAAVQYLYECPRL